LTRARVSINVVRLTAKLRHTAALDMPPCSAPIIASSLFGQRLQHCAEKDHPHCYEEAKISGQPDLFMLSALQILFLTSRKHLIATLPIFTRSLALPLALDRVSPSKFDRNPLIWMLMVNGMMVDVRHLPIEVQEVAYQKGLIPYPWRQALVTTDIQEYSSFGIGY
jgi:hypothetical protein